MGGLFTGQTARMASRNARWLRWLSAVILGVVLACLLAAAGGLLALRYWLSGPRLGAYASRLLNERLEGSFSIERVDIALFDRRVQAIGVRVSAPSGEPVLSVPSLAVRIRLLPLLKGELSLATLAASGVTVELRRDEQGQIPLTMAMRSRGAEPTPPGGRALRGVASNILLTGSTVVLAPPFAKAPTRIPVPRAGAAELKLDPRGPGILSVQNVTISAGQSQLSFAGTFAGLGPVSPGQEISLAASARLDLAELHDLIQSLPWAAPLVAQIESGTLEGSLEASQRSSPAEWQATAALSLRDLRLRSGERGVTSLPHASLACAARLDRGLITVAPCRLDAAHGSLEARAVVAEGAPLHSLVGRVSFDSFPLRAMLAPLLGDEVLPARVDGVIEAAPEDAGARTGLLVSLSVFLSGLSDRWASALAPALHLRGALAVDATRAHAIDLTLAGGPVHIEIAGEAAWAPTPTLALEVKALHTRPDALAAAIDLPLTADDLRIEAQVRGAPTAPALIGRARLTALARTGAGPHAASLSTDFRFEDSVLSFRRVELTSDGGLLLAAGELFVPRHAGEELGIRLALRTDGIELAAPMGSRASGTLRGTATLFGPATRPTGNARLTISDLRLQGIPLGATSLDASLAAGQITVSAAAQAAGGGTLTARVRYDLARESGEAELQLARFPLDLEPASTLPPELTALSALLGGRIHVAGPLVAPGVEADLTAERLRWRNIDLGVLELRVRGDRNELAAHSSLSGPVGTLQLSGTYALGERILDATFAGELESLKPLATANEALAGIDAHVRASVRVKGQLPWPAADGWIAADSIAVAGEPSAGSIMATLTSTPPADAYRIEARLARRQEAAPSEEPPRALAELVLTVRPAPTLTLLAQARFGHVQLEELSPRLARAGISVGVAGVADVFYAEENAIMRGEVNLTELELAAAGQSLRATEPVRVHAEPGLVEVPRVSFVGTEGTTFTVSGSVGATVDARVDGELSLSLLAPFLPQLAYGSGGVTLSARAEGPRAAPRFHGVLEVTEPVALRPRALERDIILRQGLVTVDSGANGLLVAQAALSGELDAGSFQLHGEGTLAGLRPLAYRVALTGQDLGVRLGDLVAEVNADLRLEGRAEGARLAGAIDLARGRYTKRFRLKDWNFVAREHETPPVGTQYPFLGALGLDLSITSEGALELKVDAGVLAMDLVLDSNLRVLGMASAPRVDGRIEARRGTITFPQAKLDVVEGAVDFAPTLAQGKPQITLRAEGEVVSPATSGESAATSTFVTLGLEGDPDQLALTLSSIPELGRVEILALLVSGEVNVAALAPHNRATATASDAAIAFAGSQLTGPLADFIARELDRAFNFKLELGAELSPGAVRVTARKEVIRRLSLEGSYLRSLYGAGSTTTARARLLFTDRLFLEGSTESTTDVTDPLYETGTRNRVELKWRLYGQ